MSEEIMDAREMEIPDLRNVVAALIDGHGDKWFKFVLRILGNTEDAQDVLQEAVRRVLLRNRPFRSKEEVRMYLARAISNTAIELYHSRKRERIRRLPLRDYLLAASDIRDPYATLEDREHSDQRVRLIKLLKEGLERLPRKQYEAVCLTLLEPGVTSMRDAGTERGIPYSTLRHRTVQGIQKLKKFIRRSLRSSPLKLVMA